jgi:hypothetical protein
MINIDLINKTPLKTEPFPYFSVEQSMLEDKLPNLVQEFPNITRGGSFNKEDLDLRDNYDALHQSLDSQDFRQALSELLAVYIIASPIMMT